MKRKQAMNILRLTDPISVTSDLSAEDQNLIVEMVEEMRDIVKKFAPHPNGYDPLKDLAGEYHY